MCAKTQTRKSRWPDPITLQDPSKKASDFGITDKQLRQLWYECGVKTLNHLSAYMAYGEKAACDPERSLEDGEGAFSIYRITCLKCRELGRLDF